MAISYKKLWKLLIDKDMINLIWTSFFGLWIFGPDLFVTFSMLF